MYNLVRSQLILSSTCIYTGFSYVTDRALAVVIDRARCGCDLPVALSPDQHPVPFRTTAADVAAVAGDHHGVLCHRNRELEAAFLSVDDASCGLRSLGELGGVD